MRPRALVLFWGATAASVLLLGSVFAVARQLGAGAAHPAEDVVLLLVAGIGLAGCLLVAGRQRRDARRRPDTG